MQMGLRNMLAFRHETTASRRLYTVFGRRIDHRCWGMFIEWWSWRLCFFFLDDRWSRRFQRRAGGKRSSVNE
jgi:hypothetical protein